MSQSAKTSHRARELRQLQTNAEGLLWSVLRSKQVCGLKFLRQHPSGPFFADFACESRQLVVELDGDYHDQIQEQDLKRQSHLVGKGWSVLRFTNDEVLRDWESVTRAIASHLGIEFSFQRRNSRRSGMTAALNDSLQRPPADPTRPLPRPTSLREVKMCRHQCLKAG